MIIDRLYESVKKNGHVCVGLDTAVEYIPDSFRAKFNNIEDALFEFNRSIIDATRDSAACFKVQIAYYEALGLRGLAAYKKTLEYIKQEFEGIIFTNLVDFDMLYGHRNDVKGYADALKEFDDRLPELLSNLREEDILFITADHGCDPTTPSTDHSREYVPLLIAGNKIRNGTNLGTRSSFSDLGQTVCDYLGTEKLPNGISFLKEIMKME
jgi:hypothetical protein